MPKFRLRAVLVRGKSGLFLMLVEVDQEPLFLADMAAAGLAVHAWIDDGVENLDLP